MRRAAAIVAVTLAVWEPAHARQGPPPVVCEAEAFSPDGSVGAWSVKLGGAFQDKRAVEQSRSVRLRAALVDNKDAGEGFTFPTVGGSRAGAVEFVSVAAPGVPERAQLHVYVPQIARLAEVAMRSFAGKDAAPTQVAVRVKSGDVTLYARAPIKPAPAWAGWRGAAHVASFGAESAWVASKPTDLRPLMNAFEQSGRMSVQVLVPKKFSLEKVAAPPVSDTPADVLEAAAFEVTAAQMKDAVAGLKTLTPSIGRKLAAGECAPASSSR